MNTAPLNTEQRFSHGVEKQTTETDHVGDGCSEAGGAGRRRRRRAGPRAGSSILFPQLPAAATAMPESR